MGMSTESLVGPAIALLVAILAAGVFIGWVL